MKMYKISLVFILLEKIFLNMKKILLSSIILLSISISSSFAEYKEISCSSDWVFSENSCVQCFDGWIKSENDSLGLLTDVWLNGTSKPMYMLKWENPLDSAVEMITLNWAAWSYEPTKDGFWEYSDKLSSIYNDEVWFYILEPNKSVDWIQSKLGYSIKLNKTPNTWENAGLLKYVLKVHVDDAWTPSETVTSHSECVLFKSAKASQEPKAQEEVSKELPQTWPQEVLLLLLALILSGLLFFASKRRI